MLPHLHQVHSQATTMCISPSHGQVIREIPERQDLRDPPVLLVQQVQRDPQAPLDPLVVMETMVQTERPDQLVQQDLLEQQGVKARLVPLDLLAQRDLLDLLVVLDLLVRLEQMEPHGLQAPVHQAEEVMETSISILLLKKSTRKHRAHGLK